MEERNIFTSLLSIIVLIFCVKFCFAAVLLPLMEFFEGYHVESFNDVLSNITVVAFFIGALYLVAFFLKIYKNNNFWHKVWTCLSKKWYFSFLFIIVAGAILEHIAMLLALISPSFFYLILKKGFSDIEWIYDIFFEYSYVKKFGIILFTLEALLVAISFCIGKDLGYLMIFLWFFLSTSIWYSIFWIAAFVLKKRKEAMQKPISLVKIINR